MMTVRYNASGLQEKVEQNFQHMGWEFQLTMDSLKRLEGVPRGLREAFLACFCSS